MERLRQPSSLTLTPEEKGEVSLLVDQVINLVREGVTGMDLLEVFLSQRIQPLQARDHPMWMYSGTRDTAPVHPEEVLPRILTHRLVSSVVPNSRKILRGDMARRLRRVLRFPNALGCSLLS